ncbi:MAG: DUF1553 domain-containing protein [Saprospiraceae bacterium]
MLRILAFMLLVVFLTSCGPSLPEEVEIAMKGLPPKLDFNIHVKPVLSDRCFSCHGPDKAKQKAGLRLDLAENAYAELVDNPGKVAIKPGKLAVSQLYHRIISDNPDEIMPPPESDLSLSPREKAILIRWIQEGAVYKPHWAFIKPARPDLPTVKNKAQVLNPIDHFIVKELEQKGWSPAPQADKETLLRRVSLDLTGLPPSIEAMDDFLADDSPNAYEKAIDKLLASPQYGERMATDWMDVARFADTHGYTVDRFRDMSPWRDWVIKAFNDNMPYDQFTIWQLAGDLLPNATDEQILATGFNRNHQQNMEGGIVQEEFRVEYVADRTNTLGTAYLGMTMECARCHDHKYDPITQKNYYEIFSFFNNVQEAGQISWDNAMPVPTLLLKDEKVDSILRFVEQKMETKQQEVLDLDNNLAPDFNQWLSKERQQTKSKLFPTGIQAHYSFEASHIYNQLSPQQKGEMKQEGVSTELSPVFAEGKNGKGLLLDGDAWLDLGEVGAFERATPFSIGIWVNIPAHLKNGVLFHKGDGDALYNLRGYHLALKENRLELLMAHTAPYNAIIEYAADIPRDQWIQLSMTYDGSSKADGLKVYLNGKEMATTVESDHLYKSILFRAGKKGEKGLQIGARWRGIGIKGAIVDDITVFDRELTALEVLQLADATAFGELLAKPLENLSETEKASLKPYFLSVGVSEHSQKKQDLQALRQRYNQTIDTVKEVMVIQEMEKPRQAYVLVRGQYDAYGEPVRPGIPESLLPMPEDLPKNRLGLAKWLLHPDHPTTARVTVNRLWQQFFGRGLVKTAEDFGNQGELPSHPELLDWLAVEFRESGWDVKKMVKLIVMSGTYRQSSKTTELVANEDPPNVFLARGPSMRLTAEMLRDNALAASGLLVKKIGGPSVKPYQPEGLWRINGTAYEEDQGEKLYRRSLYTFWKRTVPYPTQSTFDAPTRASCSVRRQKTSTPLQALILLNDPVYLEAAKVIGQHISKTENVALAISSAFRQLTGRHPSEEERLLLEELRMNEWKKFSENPEKLKGWLSSGAFVPDEKIDPASLAANTVVASTIMNADATLVKR